MTQLDDGAETSSGEAGGNFTGEVIQDLYFLEHVLDMKPKAELLENYKLTLSPAQRTKSRFLAQRAHRSHNQPGVPSATSPPMMNSNNNNNGTNSLLSTPSHASSYSTHFPAQFSDVVTPFVVVGTNGNGRTTSNEPMTGRFPAVDQQQQQQQPVPMTTTDGGGVNSPPSIHRTPSVGGCGGTATIQTTTDDSDSSPTPASHIHPDMKDVAAWLKSLRLHKYTQLFEDMTYDDMMSLDDAKLEARNVTKGARKKIVQSIEKLHERIPTLRRMAEILDSDKSHLAPIVSELRNILYTPIKAFYGFDDTQYGLAAATGFISDVYEENLPGHIIFVASKIQKFVKISADEVDDDVVVKLSNIYERVMGHDSFAKKQRETVAKWRRELRDAIADRGGSGLFSSHHGNAGTFYIRTGGHEGGSYHATSLCCPPPLPTAPRHGRQTSSTTAAMPPHGHYASQKNGKAAGYSSTTAAGKSTRAKLLCFADGFPPGALHSRCQSSPLSASSSTSSSTTALNSSALKTSTSFDSPGMAASSPPPPLSSFTLYPASTDSLDDGYWRKPLMHNRQIIKSSSSPDTTVSSMTNGRKNSAWMDDLISLSHCKQRPENDYKHIYFMPSQPAPPHQSLLKQSDYWSVTNNPKTSLTPFSYSNAAYGHLTVGGSTPPVLSLSH